MVQNATIDRVDKFKSDKKIKTASDKDYINSGFDRGHIVPARTWHIQSKQ